MIWGDFDKNEDLGMTLMHWDFVCIFGGGKMGLDQA